MKPILQHPWQLSEEDALKTQQQLASQVVQQDHFDSIDLVAGVDVAYSQQTDKLVAAVVLLNAQTLDIVESVCTEGVAQFPYIPGLFSFRELPPLIDAFAQLKNKPDLIVCDGQGYAHPRRFGIACHVGVLYDIPTIGCGKTRLIGEYKDPDIDRGSAADLSDKGEVIGKVLRTQSNVKPIYVSIGHRISLASACQWVLKLSPKYRLPETTRQADQAVRRAIKA